MKEIKTRSSSSSKHKPVKRLSRQSSKAKEDKKKAKQQAGAEKKKGKRGKKICPECDEYVPIHSQRCWNCTFLFTMNHKPKKEKVAFLGEECYTFDKVCYQRHTPAEKVDSLSIILGRNKFYGLHKP
jgi:hypothetical protein